MNYVQISIYSISSRMLMLIVIVLYVYYVPYFKDEATNTFTYTFYLLYFIISLLSSMISFASWVSMGGFCAKISDKSIGGSYTNSICEISILRLIHFSNKGTYLTFLGFWLSIGKHGKINSSY